MKIIIRKDALAIYIHENTDFFTNEYFGDYEWEELISKIAGKTLEVDTEHLFKHEFNTKPIKDISDEGIRVFEEYVEKIIDDERYGKYYCELCNKVSDNGNKCSNCGNKNYLEALIDDNYL